MKRRPLDERAGLVAHMAATIHAAKIAATWPHGTMYDHELSEEECSCVDEARTLLARAEQGAK